MSHDEIFMLADKYSNYAVRHGYIEIIKEFERVKDIDIYMSNICYNKDEKYVIELIQYFDDNNDLIFDSHDFLIVAIKNGHINILKKYIPSYEDADIDEIITHIVIYIKDYNTIMNLLDLIGQQEEIDLNCLVEDIARYGNKKLFIKIMKKYNLKISENIIIAAAKNQDINTALYIIGNYNNKAIYLSAASNENSETCIKIFEHLGEKIFIENCK
jgi:F0F1-type ATP synthase delta subunit